MSPARSLLLLCTLVLSPMIVAMATVIATMGLLIGLGFTVHIMSSMIPIFLMPIATLQLPHYCVHTRGSILLVSATFFAGAHPHSMRESNRCFQSRISASWCVSRAIWKKRSLILT